jgi:carbamate kinase
VSAPGPRRPLYVVALGGNAISPPSGSLDLAGERAALATAATELAALEARGLRLLIVHGNGPQVGRLLRAGFSADDLDVHVARTQGELGYLLVAALSRACTDPVAALITRVLVDPDDPALAQPDKPVGPVVRERPAEPAVWLPEANGWRRVVPSPRPLACPELPAVAHALERGHVIAGGGGGIPVTVDGTPVPSVVDKDHLAALLARELGAVGMLFATDVPAAFRDFGTQRQARIEVLDPAAGRALLAAGAFGAGSMGPKIDAALAFVEATGGTAHVAALGALEAAIAGRSGTRVGP